MYFWSRKKSSVEKRKRKKMSNDNEQKELSASGQHIETTHIFANADNVTLKVFGDVIERKYKTLQRKVDEIIRLRKEINECQERFSMLYSVVHQLEVKVEEGEPTQESSCREHLKTTGILSLCGSDHAPSSDWSVELGESSDDDSEVSSLYATGNGGEIPKTIRQECSRPCSRRSIHKNSIRSRQSMRRDSYHSLQLEKTQSRHFVREITEDCASSVVSHKSIQPISLSIMSLPREIEMKDGDKDENQCDKEMALVVQNKHIIDPSGERGVYSGSLSKLSGMPNGKGLLEYEKNGRWYEGDWVHGRWTGQGRLSNGQGDFYDGALWKDKRHGIGTTRFADGRVFEGNHVCGKMTEGKMTYKDGTVYQGQWLGGLRHGKGRCIFRDGSQYEGEFLKGDFHGQGKITWDDGGWYSGEWRFGEIHGTGKEIKTDGAIRHDGKWSRGQPIDF